MTVYGWIWLILGLVALGAEVAALIDRRRGDTLSEHVWAWLQRPGPWGRLRRAILVCLLLWMAIHFLSYGKLM